MTDDPHDDESPKKRRRHKKGEASGSAFDILRDQTFDVTIGSVKRKLSAGEAIQQRTLQDAFKGHKRAMRSVIKMIEEREAARPQAQRKIVSFHFENIDPKNVDDALTILDIARATPDQTGRQERPYLELEPWAVAMALSLPRRKALTKTNVRYGREATRDSDSLPWPEGTAE